MKKPVETEAFWQRFLRESGRPADLRPLDVFCFELTERLAQQLLALVLCGKKRATASSVQSFSAEGLPLPAPGSLSIITDWAGNPACVMETTRVTVLPFQQIPWELAALEGEDETLDQWRQGHERFFRAEGRQLGYAFSQELPVVFEEFKVVYQE